MNDQGDIYGKPDQDGDKQRPVVEIMPTRARERTLRSIIGFGLLMLGVFIVAAVYIAIEDKKNEIDEDEQFEFGQMSELSSSQGADASGPVVAKPEIDEMDPVDFLEGGGGDETLDPQKIAKAMGEVRIAYDYMNVSEWDQAEAHARSALKIWPDMTGALRVLGFVHMQRGQFDRAEAVFNKVLDDSPFSAETLSNLATVYLRNGMFEKAEDFYYMALDVRPGYYVANLNLGLLYLQLGRYDEAVDYYERGLEQLPQSAGPRNNMAVALLRLGRYAESREQLERLIETAPYKPQPYFNIAITYVLERDFDAAMHWIREGASRCSPVICQNYLSDTDFNALRDEPDYQLFVEQLYPDLSYETIAPAQ